MKMSKRKGGVIDLVGDVAPVTIRLSPYWDKENFSVTIFGTFMCPIKTESSGPEGKVPSIAPVAEAYKNQGMPAIQMLIREKNKVDITVALDIETSRTILLEIAKGLATVDPLCVKSLGDKIISALQSGLDIAKQIQELEQKGIQNGYRGVIVMQDGEPVSVPLPPNVEDI